MDAIKQHIEALGKWAEQDQENRSVIIITAEKKDESVSQATALVGKGEMFVRCIAAKTLREIIGDDDDETEDAESETESKEEE